MIMNENMLKRIRGTLGNHRSRMRFSTRIVTRANHRTTNGHRFPYRALKTDIILS
jgi:hypothetical protein